MNSRLFLVISILLTGFFEHSECAFYDISQYLKTIKDIASKGIGVLSTKILGEGGQKAEDNDSDYNSASSKGPPAAVHETFLPLKNRYSCEHFNISEETQRALGNNAGVPPKHYRCLLEAMNSEQFYVEIDMLYVANFLNKNSPDPHPGGNGQDPSKLKQADNVSRWVHETWWIWRRFMSGRVTYVLAQRNKPDLKSTVYDDVLFDNAFNPKLPTKIIIHGYAKNPGSSSSPMAVIKRVFDWRKAGRSEKVYEEVLPIIEANIIIVNWSSMTYKTYAITRLTMLAVARQTVSLLSRLVVDFKISLDSVDIIGHSLGAQMAGMIGNLVKQEDASRSSGQRQVGRITGLDPSLPGFLFTPKNWRLSESSAKFVQAIHTSGYTFGSARRVGHVDFYVNGGLPTQPGCGTKGAIGLQMQSTIGTALGRPINFNIQCSHFRAVTYYVESVLRPKAFIGRLCDSVIRFKMGLCNGNPITYMGEIASRNATPGSYYLNTAAKKPSVLAWMAFDK
uniref:Pancreatic lipase-related protein 2 n=1 Tax=Lygus hesperus TaxID=30085 RepID=A0A0A9ZHL8_LYGHE